MTVLYLITPGDVISAPARTELQTGGKKRTGTTEQMWKQVQEARQDEGGELGFEMSSIYFKARGIKPCCVADLVISFSLIAFR